jgi:hypothetical protein
MLKTLTLADFVRNLCKYRNSESQHFSENRNSSVFQGINGSLFELRERITSSLRTHIASYSQRPQSE